MQNPRCASSPRRGTKPYRRAAGGCLPPAPPEDIFEKKKMQSMVDRTFLDWPFFEDRHRALAEALEVWCAANLPVDHTDVDAACRGLVAMLGQGGWLRHTAAGEGARLDVRTLCLIRETLARYDGLADFAFAMQGLGMGPVTLFGTGDQRRWLERTTVGGAISGFALTEPGSGSDVAATATTADRVQGGWV